MIYFLRSGDLIKIGTAKCFKSRMYDLRRNLPCPSDTELVAWMTGNRVGERRLHEVFGEHCAFQEWFRPNRGLIKWVSAFCEFPTRAESEEISAYMRLSRSPGWEPGDRQAKKTAMLDQIRQMRRGAANARRARVAQIAVSHAGQ